MRDRRIRLSNIRRSFLTSRLPSQLTLGAVLTLFLVAGNPAKADLIAVGGGLVNDTALDVCWMQDAQYALTSGYDTDGFLTWPDAMAFVDQLEFGGYDDWRLPMASRSQSGNVASTVDCSSSTETQCRDNELGYQYYYNLAPGGAAPTAPGTDLSGDQGPFTGIGLPAGSNTVATYWTSTEFNSSNAWTLSFLTGGENVNLKTERQLQVWPVRNGQCAPAAASAIPAISGVGLAILALALALLAIRSQRSALRQC